MVQGRCSIGPISGDSGTSLFPKAARPAAPCATYCYPADHGCQEASTTDPPLTGAGIRSRPSVSRGLPTRKRTRSTSQVPESIVCLASAKLYSGVHQPSSVSCGVVFPFFQSIRLTAIENHRVKTLRKTLSAVGQTLIATKSNPSCPSVP